jgi:mono/diheme cytochrome c family protein
VHPKARLHNIEPFLALTEIHALSAIVTVHQPHKEIELRINALGNGIALLVGLALVSSQVALAETGRASKEQLRRGQYLAGFGGCSDCHTPKLMTPKGPAPDQSRLLSGHPANMQLPTVPQGAIGPTQWGALTTNDLTAWAGPWGTSFAANLTPDKETGLGSWTLEQFSKTMRTGKHLGVGRDLLPPMPWFDVAVLNDQDMSALFAYLKSLKPIANLVPAPVPPK